MSEKQNRECEVRYKQKAVVEFLTREGVKPKKIHECLEVVCDEDVFYVRMICYWALVAQKKVKIAGPRPSRSSKTAKKH